MSLIKQLWFAIVLVMLVAFGGSFLVSSLSAKNYLEAQLHLKNMDTANALASQLSQSTKDPVTVELAIAALFDIGHYQYIRIIDPKGSPIVERVSENLGNGAPGWFMALLPINAEEGVAQIQDGWKQYGTLTVSSHTRFAYRELWTSTLRLLIWFMAAAGGCGIAGTLLLRVILRPLDGVVDQAEAIGARRFITTPEPNTLEFRAVVRSMNSLARRVRQMLEEESVRLDQLRREAHFDPVTGLLNRGHFLARVRSAMEREDAGAQGALAIARMLDLNELNRTQGWAVMDSLIKRFAKSLQAMQTGDTEWVFGRLNGSDFAVLAPGHTDAAGLARGISEVIQMIASELQLEAVCGLPTAATAYQFGDQLPMVMGRVDAALAAAVAEGGSSVQIASADDGKAPVEKEDMATWRRHLDDAFSGGHVKLLSFPVVDAAAKFLHGECVARIRLHTDGEWLAAGEFMPWVSRLGYGPRLDEIVINLAIERLKHGSDDLCVNLSAQAMNDAVLIHRLSGLMGAAPELSQRLWLEVPEHGVFQNLENFRILCALQKPVGCRLGIEHVGHQVSRIGLLHDLGLDYLKVDASFVHQLDQNQANQVFLRGLAMIAHSIGLSAFAEGARTDQEFNTLIDLGFNGATGPAVSKRYQDQVGDLPL